MDEKEIYTFVGKVGATLEDMKRILAALDEKCDSFIGFQKTTEERMKSGANHFKRIDETIDEHNTKIGKMPRGGLVYTLILLGFSALGILVALGK